MGHGNVASRKEGEFSMRLQQKTVVITGGANGIGAVTATIFGQHGANIAIADFDEKAGEAKVQALQAADVNAAFFKVDVSKNDDVKEMASQVLAKFGKVDVLLNNAGITKDAMTLKMKPEDFQQVIDVNLTGVFNCTQAFLPSMVAQGKGRIINTSSISGTGGNVGQANYAASKAGIIGMTKTWAKEFGRKGVTVNAVAPGFIATEMIKTVPDHVLERIVSMISVQKLGQPEDIANAYLFLASDEAGFVNGTVLEVDGGMLK